MQHKTLPRPPFRALIATLAIGTLLLSACSSAPDSASAKQAADFSKLYQQTIKWRSCDENFGLSEPLIEKLQEHDIKPADFSCAHVTAPLDWDNPKNKKTIKLAVTRLNSTAKHKQGTIFLNPGGPGASGVELTYGMSTSGGVKNLLKHYDLLGFDPRGIARSTPVTCDTDTRITELQIAMCAKENPLALSMGTSQVARDMELMRHLVKDTALNYLGYSYGTMLGASYATIFPEQVGRMILDSAASGNWASPADYYLQTLAIAKQLTQLVSNCGTLYPAEHCPAHDEESLNDLRLRLNETPLLGSDGKEVDGETLIGYLTMALYQRSEIRTIALNKAALASNGDIAAIDKIIEAMAGGGASVGAAGTIVRCHSFPQDAGLSALLAMIEKHGIPLINDGPEINDQTIWPFMDLACDALPNSGDDITSSFSGSPDHPILVIGITNDHATPYAGAKRLVKELGNARLLTLQGFGHGASFADRSKCVDDAATKYLLHGKLPAKDTVCTDD